MEKTEPQIKKEENQQDFFLEKSFDEDEHLSKLKNKTAFLLDSRNDKNFKTIHFFYDEACKENNTFPDKKFEKIKWDSNFKEKNLSKI